MYEMRKTITNKTTLTKCEFKLFNIVNLNGLYHKHFRRNECLKVGMFSIFLST